MQGQHLVVREVKDVIIFHAIYFIARFIIRECWLSSECSNISITYTVSI